VAANAAGGAGAAAAGAAHPARRAAAGEAAAAGAAAAGAAAAEAGATAAASAAAAAAQAAKGGAAAAAAVGSRACVLEAAGRSHGPAPQPRRSLQQHVSARGSSRQPPRPTCNRLNTRAPACSAAGTAATTAATTAALTEPFYVSAARVILTHRSPATQPALQLLVHDTPVAGDWSGEGETWGSATGVLRWFADAVRALGPPNPPKMLEEAPGPWCADLPLWGHPHLHLECLLQDRPPCTRELLSRQQGAPRGGSRAPWGPHP